jgi:broad specificity phosphatase PhoE
MLYLVRHAMPVVDPAADPASWELGADGRAAARALAALLPAPGLLVASTEPKAWQTLRTGWEREVLRDSGLCEANRREGFDDGFRDRHRRYVSGEPMPGWEPQAAVARRFAAAVAHARQRAGDAHVVIGTHGMVMTIWLKGAIGLGDPAAFWDDLRFPDMLAVDLEGRTVLKVPELR